MMVEAMDHHTPPKDRSAEIVQGFKQLASDPQLMESALLDCYGRFITLLPDALLKDHVHLYFQIQEAFWWYEDVWREGNAYKLPKLSLKDFGLLITSDCPVLKKFVPPSQNEVFLRNWSRYCRTIPLRGAILLNGDLKKCLMVQGWRGGSWMFPRGKVDEMEEDSVCACREIWEEIGVDISPYIDEQVFIETVMEEQPIKLFVIPGIKESTLFVPKKRKEIGNIRWIEVKTLPGWTICGDAEADKTLSVTAVTSVDTLNSVSPSPIPASPSPPATLKFWQVNPFVNCLREWVQLLNKNSSKHRWCLAVEDAPSDIVAFRYQIPPNIPSLYLQHLQNADAHVLSKVDCKSQPPLLLHPIPIGGSAIDGSSLSNGMRENGKNIAMGSHGGEPRSALLPQNYVQNTNGFRLPSRRGGRVCAMRLKDVGQRSFDDHDVEHLLALRRRALGSYMNGEPALLSSLGGMMGPKQKRGSNLQGENSAAITGKVLLRGRGKKTAHASFDDLGVSYQRLHPLRGMGRGSAGKDSLNETTFGKESASGWSVEEMFKLNAEKFGVMSTYDIAHYTVPLPSSLPTKERNLPPQTLAPPTVLSSVTSTMRRGHTLGENASRGLPAASAVLPNTEDSLPSSSDAPQEIGHFLLSLLKKDKDIHRSVVAPPLPSVDSVSAPKEIPSSTKCGNPLRDSIAAEEAPVASGRSMILPGKLSPLSQPASFISYLDFQSFAHKMQHTIASLPEADTRVEDTVGTVSCINGHTPMKPVTHTESLLGQGPSLDTSVLLPSLPALRYSSPLRSSSPPPPPGSPPLPPLSSPPLLPGSPPLCPSPSLSSMRPPRTRRAFCMRGKAMNCSALSPSLLHDSPLGVAGASSPIHGPLLLLVPPPPPLVSSETRPPVPSLSSIPTLSSKKIEKLEALTLKEMKLREARIEDSLVASQKCERVTQSEEKRFESNPAMTFSEESSQPILPAKMPFGHCRAGNSIEEMAVCDVEWTCIAKGMEAALRRRLSRARSDDDRH